MTLYDVAVVGAGPAGTSFAKAYLDRRPDARVLILEGIKRPSTLDPSQPGAGHSMCSGGLGRYMTETIGQIPKNVVMADVNQAILRSPHGEVRITAETVGTTGPIGLVLNRKKWDDWLLAEAIRAGAEYVNGARAVGFQLVTAYPSHERAWKVSTKDGRSFDARFLVGADGPESLVAAQCLGSPPVLPEDMFIASEVYVPAAAFPRDAILLHFQTSRLLGYYWAFSAGAVVKVGCGTTRASKVNPSAETEWWRLECARTYGDAGFVDKPTEAVGGRITAAPPLRTVVNPYTRVAVIGEAARAVWASIGAGDASAVETGRALANALANDDPGGYQRWWHKHSYPWLMRHYRIKNLLLGLTDDQLDRMTSVLAAYQPKSTNTRREVPRLIAHVARHDPGLLGTAALKAILG